MTANEVEAIVEAFCSETGVGINLQVTGSKFPFKAAALGALFKKLAEKSQARVNAEREACAKIADTASQGVGEIIAAVIRART